jgi:hypothetical protein
MKHGLNTDSIPCSIRVSSVARYWAVAVDATVLSMFFWGFSGLFVWWQIKAVRLGGIASLLAAGPGIAARQQEKPFADIVHRPS